MYKLNIRFTFHFIFIHNRLSLLDNVSYIIISDNIVIGLVFPNPVV